MKKYLFLLLWVLTCYFPISSQAVEVTLYAQFSDSQATTQVDMEEVTALNIANALTEWTGLPFTLNSSKHTTDSVTVDWALTSSLLDPEQDLIPHEGFHFTNTQAMQWFMLDTLFVTLQKNLQAASVFYTQDSGKPLHITNLTPIQDFPLHIAYAGSASYKKNAVSAGPKLMMSPKPIAQIAQEKPPVLASFENTEGVWKLATITNEAPALIVMDGKGGFASYTKVGALLFRGRLQMAEDTSEDLPKYHMFNFAQKHVNTLEFRSQSEFQLGLETPFLYVKKTATTFQ